MTTCKCGGRFALCSRAIDEMVPDETPFGDEVEATIERAERNDGYLRLSDSLYINVGAHVCELCGAVEDAWIEEPQGEDTGPTVVRDRRPTRAEVEAAMRTFSGARELGGPRRVARFLLTYDERAHRDWQGKQYMVEFSTPLYGYDARCVTNWGPIHSTAFLEPDTHPGESYRPIGPDGEPLRLEVLHVRD